MPISIPSILSILSRVLAPGNSLREPRAHSTVTSMSSGVRSPVSERPSHHRTSFLPSPLCAVLPQERLTHIVSLCVRSSHQERLTHILFPFTRAGNVRHLSHPFRWIDAQRYSLSNTRFRSLPTPPSSSLLQLLEFEATPLHPTSTPTPPEVRRQRSHAC